MQTLDVRVSSDALTGQALPPQSLRNLTFAVKDMFAVAGKTPGFGSPDWKSSHGPSSDHAPSVETLLKSGAHLVANAVCDELAFSLDGINIHYGTPLNPRAPERIPGGSSSGPSSVVAQGLVDFALGTDTAGSTRVPASYCGIWGLRPTHGSISCEGVLPLGPTFDTVGLLAANPDILRKVATVLIKTHNNTKANRLIIVSDCFDLLAASLLPPVVALANKLRRLFNSSEEQTVVADGLPTLVSNFGTIRGLEAWQCHGQWFESADRHLSPAVAKRLIACRGISQDQAASSRQYRQAQQVKFRALLDRTVLCLPTTANLPPLKTAAIDELETNRSLNMQLNSIASFLGLPQLTIPIQDNSQGLSPGLSIIGAEGSELELLRLAEELTQ